MTSERPQLLSLPAADLDQGDFARIGKALAELAQQLAKITEQPLERVVAMLQRAINEPVDCAITLDGQGCIRPAHDDEPHIIIEGDHPARDRVVLELRHLIETNPDGWRDELRGWMDLGTAMRSAMVEMGQRLDEAALRGLDR